MKQYLVDVPVAIIFFNRPEVLAPVFECVRKSRPSKLFLIQDGARANRPNDITNIQKCRNIVEKIDWDCEVNKDYSDINLGCGRRIFTGLTNAFKKVDRLIIVEDDITFNDSFIPFCAEMLERYKDDERIVRISGMNHLGIYEPCPYSYFFSKGGAIWGWATWKRVWDVCDWNLEAADDDYLDMVLRKNKYETNLGPYLADKSRALRVDIKNGKYPSFWSFHYLYYSYLQNGINIIPKFNLISNIGLTADTTHAVDNLKKIDHVTQKVFFTKMYELPQELVHPKYVIDDFDYKRKQDFIMRPSGLRAVCLRLECLIRRILYK